MPFYPNEVIQQLKAQADISLVIQQFIPLKKSGNGRFVGMCPFHDDHSPSMSVNPTLGIYKCFACGAGGDVFKFVQEHEKIDFNGAVEWVANFVGFPLPNFASKESAEVTEERAMVRKLNELACEWFEQQLALSPKALEYLAKRNISESTRREFHIGYAPDGREGFIGYAARNGFSPRDCVKAGLATEKKNGGIADKFRDRLMIAIQNQSGIVVAFGGRDLAPKQEGFERPKYMNSPDTALYNKSDILFGLNHSRASIAKENAVIIVEGYFDLISLYQGGVTNVVAASGTALTETHASILSRYAKTAYLVFDGDAAGRKATLRSLEIVLPGTIRHQHLVVKPRVHHNLRSPRLKLADKIQQICFRNSFPCHDACKMIRCSHPFPLRLPGRQAGQRPQPQTPNKLAEAAKLAAEKRRARRAQGLDARSFAQGQDYIYDARQGVHVLMAVRMSELKPCALQLIELGRQLCPHFFQIHPPCKKMFHQHCVIIKKDALCRHQGRNFPWRQYRVAIDQSKMNADPQLFMAPCHSHCRLKGLAPRHQGSRTQAAFGHTFFNCLIDKLMPAEIIGIDN